VLAGALETAVNALWDARPLVGDRVAVVGAGIVGLCAARLLARVPGASVTVVDTDTTRAEVAAELGVSVHRVTLAWHLAQADVVVPIPGATRPESITDSAAAAELKLTPGQRRRLDAD